MKTRNLIPKLLFKKLDGINTAKITQCKEKKTYIVITYTSHQLHSQALKLHLLRG